MTHDLSSTDYAAVRHILTSPAIASRTAAFIGGDDFDWEGLLVEQQTMSAGQRLLVLIAHDLWNAGGVVRVSDITRRLDRRNFERVLDALSISRGDRPLPRHDALADAA